MSTTIKSEIIHMDEEPSLIINDITPSSDNNINKSKYINNNLDLNNSKLTNVQINLLKQYKDKSLITSILAKRSFDYFSTIKTFVNLPLVLSSSSLAILNSANLNAEQMKIPNIIINGITGLTLAMIGNFKISEKAELYKNISNKMTKLNHRIEESLINDIDNLDKEKLSNYIKEYESLIELLNYPFPTSVKKKVYEKYKNSGLYLPNSLIGFDDINISDLNSLNITGSNMV